MNAPLHLSESPVYKKAIDIFTLSHNISTYLNQDLAHLSHDGKEDENIYFSGDIIQQSVSLAPHILKAEQAPFSDKKYKHATLVKQLTNKLYRNCKRLENCNSNGKDYLPILRSELRKFKKLQKTWSLTL
ncbi:hypothetical protein [Aurantibacter sp.]|uniref:hypothetical protein n=1 Tax=Aurantibacter sp. TaxID=2807103 RepID=UPI0035C7D322